MTANSNVDRVNRALAFHDEGKFEEAEQLFLEALYLMDDKENELYQRIVYGLGMNYSRQKNYAGAKQCYEEARLNARKANNVAFELDMLRQLMILTRQTGDVDGLELLLRETLLYWEKYQPEDEIALAAIYHEAGKMLLEVEQFQKSQHYLEKAKSLAIKSQNEATIALVHIALGTLHMNLGEFEEAKESLLISKGYYDNQKNKKILNQIELRIQQLEQLERTPNDSKTDEMSDK